MRLRLDSGPLAAIRTRVEAPRFVSSLPSEATLASAWADPAVRAQLLTFNQADPDSLGRKLQATAMDAFAVVQARVGTSIGVPGVALGDFARSVAADALEDGEVNWAQFALSGAQAATDIALDAMGAVPIVGWIAKAAMAIINAVISAASNDRPRPLLLRYSRDRDEDAAQQAIERIGRLQSASNPNWNPLFMPPGRGGWRYTEAENGYVIQPNEPTDGLGGIPSGVTGFRSIQVKSWPSIVNALERERGRPGQLNPDNPLANNYVQSTVVESSEDTFSQLPSLQRVILAAWSAASTNNTAAVFNLQPDQIRGGWREYVEDALAFANLYRNGAGPQQAMALAARQQVTQQRIEIRVPQGYTFAGRPLPVAASRLRLDLITDAWCDFIDKRQIAMMRTPAVAFCSEDQFAFQRSPPLRQRLIEGRQLFNTTLDANDIDPDDIIDPEFRDAVVSYNGSRSGRMPGSASKTPHNIPPIVAVPMGSAGGGVLAAMLIGAAWLAVRSRKGRRR
jgi:hypothetical protein